MNKLRANFFDTNQQPGQQPAGPVPVADSVTWTRIVTLDTGGADGVIGMDITCTTNPVKIRLTKASFPGNNHGLLQTDMTQVGRYVLLATNNGTGTVNQPNVGDIVCLNVNAEGASEIGVEAQLVTAGASASVRVSGSSHET